MKLILASLLALATTSRAFADPDPLRPEGTSIGIGAGYAFHEGTAIGSTGTDTSVDLRSPNVTSVRVRLRSGVTLEPFFALRAYRSTVDSPPVDVYHTHLLEFGGLVRVPLARRGRVDLELVGSVLVDHAGADELGTAAADFSMLSVGAGVALGYWLSPHFQVIATASNPLVEYTSSLPVGGTRSTGLSIGAAFEPQLTVMAHMYL